MDKHIVCSPLCTEEGDHIESSDQVAVPVQASWKLKVSLLGVVCVFAIALATAWPRPAGAANHVTSSFSSISNKDAANDDARSGLCEDKLQCLDIVDDFFKEQPRGVLGLFQTYSSSLGGGSCGTQFCSLPKQSPCRCDVYDNAVAVIYLVKRGHLSSAKRILEVLMNLLYPKKLSAIYPEELYSGLPSGRAITFLAASYSCDTKAEAGDYFKPKGIVDGTVDTGNNAWVAMAFAHYAKATGSGCHAAVAKDILHALQLAAQRCHDHLGGFLAKLPPERRNQRSVEHNIDVAALAGMLGNSQAKEEAQKFVKGMFGQSKQVVDAYAMGTGWEVRCDTSQLPDAPVAADGIFWNLLADADPDPSHADPALRFALQSLWDEDIDRVFSAGTEPPPVLQGTRFTNHGNGVQWEVTAGAAMAIAHYLQKSAADSLSSELRDLMQKRLAQGRASLRRLLTMYKGVPSSVKGGNYAASQLHNAFRAFPGGTDTGLNYAYFRYLHTAATAWTGLLLLYQAEEGDTINSDANPFGEGSKVLPSSETSCLPKQEHQGGVAVMDFDRCGQ